MSSHWLYEHKLNFWCPITRFQVVLNFQYACLIQGQFACIIDDVYACFMIYMLAANDDACSALTALGFKMMFMMSFDEYG